MPEQIHTDHSFHEITHNNENVVIQFMSRSCGMSRMSQGIFDMLENQCNGVKFVKIDVNDNPDTCDRLNIRNTPTFMFFKQARKIDQLTINGVDDLEGELKQNLQNLLS